MKKILEKKYKEFNPNFGYVKWLESVIEKTNEHSPINLDDKCVVLPKKFKKSKEYENLFKKSEKLSILDLVGSFKEKPKKEKIDELINDFSSILEKRSLSDWAEFRSKPIQPKHAPSCWIDLFNVFGENTKLIEEENTKSIQEFVTTLKLKPSENEPVFKIDSYEAAHKAHDSFFNSIISEMEKNFPSSIPEKNFPSSIPEEKIIRLPENVQKYVSEIKGKLRLIKSKKSSTRWLERIVLNNSLYVSQNSTKDFIENGMCKTKKYAEQVDWFPKKEKQYRDMNLQEMNSYCFENGYDFHKIVKKGLFNDYRYKKPNDNVLRKFKRIEVK